MENSIEILGQKFSYPSTWQGTASILIVGATICFIAWTLEPQQINAYVNGISPSNKETESKLVAVNKSLTDEVVNLRKQVLDLAEKSSLDDVSKKDLLSKVEGGKEAIDLKFGELINAQQKRANLVGGQISSSNQQQQQMLSAEAARLNQQLGQFQQQQQQQKY